MQKIHFIRGNLCKEGKDLGKNLIKLRVKIYARIINNLLMPRILISIVIWPRRILIVIKILILVGICRSCKKYRKLLSQIKAI